MENRERGNNQDCRAGWLTRGIAALSIPALLILLTAVPAHAQRPASDTLPLSTDSLSARYWRVGLAGALGVSAHDVSLDIYANSPGCGLFTGQSTGMSFVRLFFETPIIPSLHLAVTGGGVFQNRSINFAQTFNTLSRYPDGTFEQIVTQQRLDGTIVGIGPFAGLLWEPLPNIRVGIAPSLLFMTAKNVRQYEEIVAPFGAVFTETNDYQRPVDRGGELYFNTQGVDLSAWLGTSLPIGKHLLIMPEVGVNFLLTSLEQSTSWKATTGYFSLGLSWNQSLKKKGDVLYDSVKVVASVIDTQEVVQAIDTSTLSETDTLISSSPEIDTLSPAAKTPASFWVDITAVGIDKANREYSDPVIEVSEAPWSQSIPLIPYIFFDSGSSAIPSRYVLFKDPAQADRLNIDSMIGMNPVTLHRQLLNVLGQRMRSRPEVAVTIVGTTSIEESYTPQERTRLSEARAESVRQYLQNIWKIDGRRITVIAGRPTNASSEETADGRAENRRAEFFFDGESLMRPVVVERLARIASPPAIKFYPKLVATDTNAIRVADWFISVMQGEKELLRIDGNEHDSLSLERQYWSLGELRINRDLTPIRYRLEVRDSSGQVAAAEKSFTVKERTTRLPDAGAYDNLEIREFLLVGFTYNSAELQPSHLAEIHEIARMADEKSWVEVVGFTDRVGDALHNHKLAIERARNVADTLRAIRVRLSEPEIPISTERGTEEVREGVYDNNFPEGRIFSRMVRVTVNRRPR